MLAAVTAIAALATDYTGILTVTVNGESTSTESTISIVQNGSDYTLSINNFEMDGMPIGNIVVTAPDSTSNGLTSIVTSQEITITEGDKPGVDTWFGPLLGVVPINMVLAFNQFAMTTNIDIYMADLGQTINVKFAQDGELTGYQIKNSGFENFKSNGEPLAWHGFKSATGAFASWAKGKLESSNEVREGATGKCAVITSGDVFGIVNNGTMTTGRLNAGNMQATHTDNCSKMDFSVTDTDANKDPFYTIMHGRPDAITVWMKFSQATANSNYPYASFSAIITDGTYYQDPEDKTYTNKLATAKNTTITTGGWREITIPFNYIDNNINGLGLLVTISTNAAPGQGSSGDKVWVDDIAMVYNAAITGISVKGAALEGFSQNVYEYNFELADGETISESDIDATFISEHAYLVKKVLDTPDSYKVFVAVISNDLNTIKVYTINYLKPQEQPQELDGVEFTNGRKWATWYGDMDLALPENVTASVVTGIKNNAVTLQSIDYIPAGVGVLLYSDASLSLVKANKYKGTTTSVSSLLMGSTKSSQISNAYVLYNNDFILLQEDNTEVPAHRCYLPVPEGQDNAPLILRIGNSTVTAITGIENIVNGKTRYFDLNGREVNENATGILLRQNPDGTVTKVVK